MPDNELQTRRSAQPSPKRPSIDDGPLLAQKGGKPGSMPRLGASGQLDQALDGAEPGSSAPLVVVAGEASGVLPNDPGQQEAALPRPDLAQLKDEEICKYIEQLAARRAELMLNSAVKQQRDKDRRAAKAAVELQIRKMKAASKGKSPTRAEAAKLVQAATEGIPEPERDALREELRQGQVEWLEGHFDEELGGILFKRGGGAWSNLRAQLRKAEAGLVKQRSKASKKSPAATPEELGADIAELRATYSEKLQTKTEVLKHGFKVITENQTRFQFEAQPGVNANPMERPAPGSEPTMLVKDLGGLVNGQGNLPVAASVVLWLQQLKGTAGLRQVKFGAGTYKGHSWGEYSIDVFLSAKKTEDGFFEQQQAVQFFLAAEEAAALADVQWRALYNDFEVAKEVNAQVGKRRVSFQWKHGPDPFVLHLHFDIMPILPAHPMCQG